jgi:hypothetical protein
LGRGFDLGLILAGGLVPGGFQIARVLVQRVLIERIEELLLGLGDGLCVERGDLGCGLGLLGGALGLRGKVCAIA